MTRLLKFLTDAHTDLLSLGIDGFSSLDIHRGLAPMRPLKLFAPTRQARHRTFVYERWNSGRVPWKATSVSVLRNRYPLPVPGLGFLRKPTSLYYGATWCVALRIALRFRGHLMSSNKTFRKCVFRDQSKQISISLPPRFECRTVPRPSESAGWQDMPLPVRAPTSLDPSAVAAAAYHLPFMVMPDDY